MSKHQILFITIPEPCHESWDEMKPNGCGKFCGQCEKTVIDFTEMTDEEVVKIMTKSVSIPCGRFKETQLNSTIIIPEEKRSKPLLQIISKIAASFLLLQTIVINSFGQKQEGTSMEQTSATENVNNNSDIDTSAIKPISQSRLIRGTVIDGASTTNPKEGLPGANVKIVGANMGTQTDIDGNFEIEIPANSTMMFEISSMGYKTEIQRAVFGLKIELAQNTNVLGGYSMTRVATKHKFNFWNLFKKKKK